MFGLKLNDISYTEILNYADYQRQAGNGVNLVNRMLLAVRYYFTYLQNEGKITHNPAAGISLAITTKTNMSMKSFVKILSTSLLLFLSVQKTNAQLELNAYSGQSEISAKSSVVLKSGFHIPAGNSVRIFVTALSFKDCQPQYSQPTGSQNYILTRTFRKAGVVESNLNMVGTMCEENQVIQYFDGLGRPLQTIALNGGAAGHDLITPVSYDAFGREDKKYLPYTAWNNNGAYRSDAASGGQAAYYRNPPGGIKATNNAFSQTVFEASPLNRVFEQGAPGDSGQPIANSTAGHTIKMEYGTNAANDVKLWSVTSTGATASTYAAGTLHLTVSKDENWVSGRSGTTEEYKDFEDRVVLKRVWQDENGRLETYYVYDDFGNLRYVLSPAVNEGTDRGSAINSFVESDKVFSDFIYGYRFDGRQRMIAKKIPGKGWEEMIYNPLDQLVFSQDAVQREQAQRSFIKYDGVGRITMTGVESNHTESRETVQATVNGLTTFWDTPSNLAGNLEGYNNLSAPSYLPHMRVDVVNYYDDYAAPGMPYSYAGSYSQKTKGLLTATKVRVLDTDQFLWTVNYYDEEGRVVKSYKQHFLAGTAQNGNYDEVSNAYNFDGSIASSTRLHKVNAGISLTVANRYEYDHQGRKLATFEKINQQDEIALNHYVYNEIGQLKEKRVHNDKQSTSYAYNERNWLTRSTSNEFSIELKYQDGTQPNYNGNISNQYWGAGNSLPNAFNYGYDRLNRLTSATSTDATLNEVMTYDVMGNIKTLSRANGDPNGYFYPNGNQLWYVAYVSDGYSYDSNGNTIVDGRLHYSIDYNHLNLPKRVSTINLNYVYDATGAKLRKNSNGSVRNYIDGIEYNPNGTIDVIHTEEGLAQNNGNSDYTYHYNLKDHLGNVRYTFDIYNDGVRKLQQDDYYAFGLRKAVVGGNNKYLYNGKEIQNELGGQYDYGARFYDPVIGRWNAVDPLAEEYDEWSPYNYTINNPLRFIDPDGRSVQENEYESIEDPKKKTKLPIQLQEVKVTATRMLSTAATIFTGVAFRTGAQWASFGADPEPITKTLLGVGTAIYTGYVIADEISKYRKTSVNSQKYQKEKSLSKKDSKLKGGKQNARDKGLTGYPKSFKDWLHHRSQDDGMLEDYTIPEIKELWKEWKDAGKPERK